MQDGFFLRTSPSLGHDSPGKIISSIALSLFGLVQFAFLQCN